MHFSNFPYRRPNMDEVYADYEQAIEELYNAKTAKTAMQAIIDVQQLKSNISTQYNLAYVRHSIDTRDSFYDQENTFWDNTLPEVEAYDSRFYEVVLNSPFRQELETQIPATFFKVAENHLKQFSPEILEDLQEENRLMSEYSKLIASAEIEFHGRTYNLSEMTPFMQSPDRKTRQEASLQTSRFFESHLDTLDTIYDKLVAVRTKMAKKLGYDNFIDLGYLRMNRFDYNQEDVRVFRENILADVVPVAENIYADQANRLGLDQLYHYDLNFKYPTGNPIPKGNSDKLLKQAVKMYHEMSPETGEFIDFMMEHHLMDLESKPGKQSGGYCIYFSDFYSPFIFANFNNTAHDVEVLTHEAGHALQNYLSRWIKFQEAMEPTLEVAEIHSMSMEFFAWPWMEHFFKEDTPKYKHSHITGAITFLPYGVLVDHFQHEIYANPAWTPDERRQCWRRLEKQYMPWKVYHEDSFLEAGGFWFRQSHIFEDPFYYIDYTFAQVCALQFWKRSYIDKDSSSWSDYLRICRLGGTKSFKQVVKQANLVSPFQSGTLPETMKAVQDYLASVSEIK